MDIVDKLCETIVIYLCMNKTQIIQNFNKRCPGQRSSAKKKSNSRYNTSLSRTEIISHWNTSQLVVVRNNHEVLVDIIMPLPVTIHNVTYLLAVYLILKP